MHRNFTQALRLGGRREELSRSNENRQSFFSRFQIGKADFFVVAKMAKRSSTQIHLKNQYHHIGVSHMRRVFLNTCGARLELLVMSIHSGGHVSTSSMLDGRWKRDQKSPVRRAEWPTLGRAY